MPTAEAQRDFDVVVVGGGSAGIGVTASLLRRRPDLRIGVIEPSDKHYYQPAWTLVGGGAFDIAKTVRPTRDVMPRRATWLQAAAAGFEPEANRVLLSDGRAVSYQQLIVCPGLRLAWDKVEGLADTLGKNGVSSNYRYDLAPYTWELVRGLKGGRALFTQPAMPIKCAGAPQKAMYLACDHWKRTGVLDRIDVEFDLAGAALFGVPTFVPPLMRYVESYGIALAFNSALVAVDGAARKAWFDLKNADGAVTRVEKSFDMLHAVARAPWQRVRAGRRHLHQQRQDRRGCAQTDRHGGGKSAGAARRPCHARQVRRLWLLPADGGARTHRAGRVRLRRQTPAHLPAGPDRAAQERLVPQGDAAALDLLERHAKGPRMAGPPVGQLSVS
jgi:hypothetical protein